MTQTLPAPLDVKLMNLTASVLFVGCAMAVLAAGAWWVLRYPGFAIARIVVQGYRVVVHQLALHHDARNRKARVAQHPPGPRRQHEQDAAHEQDRCGQVHELDVQRCGQRGRAGCCVIPVFLWHASWFRVSWCTTMQ